MDREATTQPRPPEHTSGSDDREPRELIAPVVVVGIASELERLRDEPAYRAGDRNAVTLAKEPDLRVVLAALRPGARIGEEMAHGRLTVEIVEGAVEVSRDGEGMELVAGELAVLDSGRAWSIEAREESAALLTMTWPEERSLL
jgi:quercetin dioxygenase-like cupin family protein